MKITSFNPMILSKEAPSAIQLFEELGFKQRHHKKFADNEEIMTTRMKDENGFYVDVSIVPEVPQDMSIIRMNVDDFDEAYELLKSHGFENTGGDAFNYDPSSKSALMMAPTGFGILLVKHIKKH